MRRYNNDEPVEAILVFGYGYRQMQGIDVIASEMDESELISRFKGFEQRVML